MSTTDTRAPEVVALETRLGEKDQQIARLTADLQAAKDAALSANTRADEKARLSQTFEGEVTARDTEIRTLKASLSAATAATEEKDTEIRTLKAKLQSAEDAALETKVTKLMRDGLDRGIPAAVFEGFDKDPVAAVKSKFGTVVALETLVNSYPAKQRSAPVSSGREADDTVSLSQERREHLQRMGLDPKMALVQNSNDLKSLTK